jgi:hypothetical protein
MRTLLLIAALFAAPAASAHGTIPTANAIEFMPDGTLMLGTNFGAIHRGTSDTFICETSVTGTQQALDLWRVLPDGSVAAAVRGGDFMRGVYLSDTSGCVFELVAGTENLAVQSLAIDQSGDSVVLIVAGTRPDTCSDCPEVGTVESIVGGVLTPLTTHPEPATGLALGAVKLAVFSSPGRAAVVSFGATLTTATPTIAEDSTLIPLGLAGRDFYAVVRKPDGDEVVVSADQGATLQSLGTMRGRIYGFAANADKVWFQSPQLGVLTRDGDTIVEVPFSPHGSCLAWRDDQLWACGVPWQDGFAVGVSADGVAFTAVMPFFDGIAGARQCDTTLTATCDAELDFLRGYYGFSEIVEPGPEISEVSEPLPEAVEPIAEPGPESAETPRDDGGCASGAGVFWLGLAGLAVLYLYKRRGLSPVAPMR